MLHRVFGSGSSICLMTLLHSLGTRLFSGAGVAEGDSAVPREYCDR
jgi:hypothetical protein